MSSDLSVQVVELSDLSVHVDVLSDRSSQKNRAEPSMLASVDIVSGVGKIPVALTVGVTPAGRVALPTSSPTELAVIAEPTLTVPLATACRTAPEVVDPETLIVPAAGNTAKALATAVTVLLMVAPAANR